MKITTKILSFIHNYWMNPSNRVIIKHPDCKRGHYHDADYIMMFVMFQMVVNFIEIECGALLPNQCFETGWKKWFRRVSNLTLLHWFIMPPRNALRGLFYLKWEMSLKDHPRQAQCAKELFLLYKFWKHTRPRREEPFAEAYTFTDEEEGIGKKFGGCSLRYSAFLKRSGDLEEQQDQEDQEMLVKLINIRRSLWT